MSTSLTRYFFTWTGQVSRASSQFQRPVGGQRLPATGGRRDLPRSWPRIGWGLCPRRERSGGTLRSPPCAAPIGKYFSDTIIHSFHNLKFQLFLCWILQRRSDQVQIPWFCKDVFNHGPPRQWGPENCSWNQRWWLYLWWWENDGHCGLWQNGQALDRRHWPLSLSTLVPRINFWHQN